MENDLQAIKSRFSFFQESLGPKAAFMDFLKQLEPPAETVSQLQRKESQRVFESKALKPRIIARSIAPIQIVEPPPVLPTVRTPRPVIANIPPDPRPVIANIPPDPRPVPIVRSQPLEVAAISSNISSTGLTQFVVIDDEAIPVGEPDAFDQVGGLVPGLLVLDRAVNAATGGSIDETISSRVGGIEQRGGNVPGLSPLLNAVSPGHAQRARSSFSGRSCLDSQWIAPQVVKRLQKLCRDV